MKPSDPELHTNCAGFQRSAVSCGTRSAACIFLQLERMCCVRNLSRRVWRRKNPPKKRRIHGTQRRGNGVQAGTAAPVCFLSRRVGVCLKEMGLFEIVFRPYGCVCVCVCSFAAWLIPIKSANPRPPRRPLRTRQQISQLKTMKCERTKTDEVWGWRNWGIEGWICSATWSQVLAFFLAGDSCGLTQSTRSDGGRTKQNKEVRFQEVEGNS